MKILILGSSKTGTTAITYAIKNKLPDHDIVFEPANLQDINYEQGNLLVKSLRVNDWEKYQDYFDKFDRKILIVRHPFDRLISLMLYTPFNVSGFLDDRVVSEYVNLLKRKVEKPDEVDTIEIINFLDQIKGSRTLLEFQKVYNNILSLHYNKSNYGFHVLKYEDFVDGNLAELERYLGISLEHKVKVASEYKRVERTKNHGDWKNWLTQKDIQKFSRFFAELNLEMQYSTSIDADYVRLIHAQYSYLYTINVINENRSRYNLPRYEEGSLNLGAEGVLIEQAIQLLKKNNFVEAKDTIGKAIDLNSKIPGAYLVLGKILTQQNKFREAVLETAKSIDIDPEFNSGYEYLRDIASAKLEWDQKHKSQSKKVEDKKNKVKQNRKALKTVKFPLTEFSELLVDFGINAFLPDNNLQSTSIIIRGWILGKNSLAKNVSVTLDGEILAQSPVDRSRPKVYEKYPSILNSQNSGFEMVVDYSDKKADSKFTVEAILEDKTCLSIGTVFLDFKQC